MRNERFPTESISTCHEQRDASHEDEHCQSVADFGNDVAQSVKLYVERCTLAVVDLCSCEHFAILCGIAHSDDAHNAMAVHHGGAAHGVVGRVGGFIVKVGCVARFLYDGFAGECGFVDLQRNTFQQLSVRRHFHTRSEHHDVAHHDVAFGHFCYASVADGLHGVVIVHLVQDVESAVGFHLKPKADARGQNDGNEDAYRFKENAKVALRFAFVKKLEAGNAHRSQESQ